MEDNSVKIGTNTNSPIVTGRVKGSISNQVRDSSNTYNQDHKQSLADAAAEIQTLLEQLEKTYPANTTTGKMAIATEALAQIEGDKSLSERVLSALKVGGVSAFEQLLNHPAASFVIGALGDWQKTKGN
ncbi:MAG: hypothetical protein KME54_24630 [Tolypothrix brevis GSE-NOS-MK-07-07A]|jgi:tRNA U34 5-carboxymethylaminomethyl modifying GTPase MnmE/TrmE|nr:hypothetical protein [Tolypothrix brevis GSE-NOS-MK-07-07A]